MYDARLDPTEGSEQAGTRPIVIVSRNAINAANRLVVAVPCTSLRPGKRIYPSHVVLRAPDGGLTVDSIALCEQVRVLSRSRLGRRRGLLSAEAQRELDRALIIALDLDRP